MLRGASALVFACLVLATTGCPKDPSAPAGATPGAPAAVWKPKSFTRVTEGCSQSWTCDCSAFPARAGCKIEGSRDDTTQGLCGAESGPHAACTRCMALPPATACACKYTCP